MAICEQGPPDSFPIVNTLLNALPRDSDYNSEMWTTVDMNKNNARDKGKMILIQGFSLYLVFMGKNFAYEGKTETRYRDILIVCNVQPSSGPIDMEGLTKQASDYKQLISAAAAQNARQAAAEQADQQAAARIASALVSAGAGRRDQHNAPLHLDLGNPQDVIAFLEEEMDIDMDLLRKGVVSNGNSTRNRNKVIEAEAASIIDYVSAFCSNISHPLS